MHCIPDDFSSDDDINQFFEALGSGSKDDLIDDESSHVSILLNFLTFSHQFVAK